jgi:mono/diheme cytochrome c family protein
MPVFAVGKPNPAPGHPTGAEPNVVTPSRGGVTYDPGRMSRTARYAAVLAAGILIAFAISACGTQKVAVPKSDPTFAADTNAAQLFNERCGGCHSLSQAGTEGSGQNPRTYLDISGPNFNQRCERPVSRVLYAIENGGFSGAYMPQNIVVGQQAREVAMFVAKYAGGRAPIQPGVTKCSSKPIGTLPALPTKSPTS